MTSDAFVLFLYAETPIHAGASGGPGFVDNQIQRDATTRLPVIHASGIKGVLRDHLELEPGGADPVLGTVDQAGKVLFSDARLLLLPVPSLAGVFAWVTCPLALQRLERDMALFGLSVPSAISALRKKTDTLSGANAVVAGSDCPTVVAHNPDRIVLDDFCFQVTACPEVAAFAKWISGEAFPKGTGEATSAESAWAARMWNEGAKTSSLVVLGDEAFRDLSEFCLTIVERNKVEEGSKTVPWTEEHLPAESLLYGMLTGLGRGQQGAVAAVSGCIAGRSVLQVGGTVSLGRGLLSARIHPTPQTRAGAANGHVSA